ESRLEDALTQPLPKGYGMHTSRFQDLGRRSRESGNPGIPPRLWVPALRCASAGTTRTTLQSKTFHTCVHAVASRGEEVLRATAGHGPPANVTRHRPAIGVASPYPA